MTHTEMIEMVLRSQDILDDDKSKFITSIINEEKAKSYNEGFKNGCQRGKEAIKHYRFG